MADDQNLTTANVNPWYVLMTIWGEQEGDEVDWDLHAKNRDTWNRFWAEAINANWARQDGATLSALDPLDDAERAALAARCEDRGVVLPVKQDGLTIDLTRNDFTKDLILDCMIFPVTADFREAVFQRYADFCGAARPSPTI